MRVLLAVILTTVLLVSMIFWPATLQPGRDGFTQVGVVADFQAYREALERYRTAHGRYPLHLADATSDLEFFSTMDRWGAPLIYLSDGSFFVLVSTGKEGHSEGENYIAARGQVPRVGQDPACSDPRVDQILTDRGWYRGCGK